MISHTELRARQSAKVIAALIDSDAWKAVLYLSEKEIVRATRLWYKRLGKSGKPAAKRLEVLVSIGPPNFLERQFIAACVKAGERFPVAKIQLKFRKYAK